MSYTLNEAFDHATLEKLYGLPINIEKSGHRYVYQYTAKHDYLLTAPPVLSELVKGYSSLAELYNVIKSEVVQDSSLAPREISFQIVQTTHKDLKTVLAARKEYQVEHHADGLYIVRVGPDAPLISCLFILKLLRGHNLKSANLDPFRLKKYTLHRSSPFYNRASLANVASFTPLYSKTLTQDHSLHLEIMQCMQLDEEELLQEALERALKPPVLRPCTWQSLAQSPLNLPNYCEDLVKIGFKPVNLDHKTELQSSFILVNPSSPEKKYYSVDPLRTELMRLRSTRDVKRLLVSDSSVCFWMVSRTKFNFKDLPLAKLLNYYGLVLVPTDRLPAHERLIPNLDENMFFWTAKDLTVVTTHGDGYHVLVGELSF